MRGKPGACAGCACAGCACVECAGAGVYLLLLPAAPTRTRPLPVCCTPLSNSSPPPPALPLPCPSPLPGLSTRCPACSPQPADPLWAADAARDCEMRCVPGVRTGAVQGKLAVGSSSVVWGEGARRGTPGREGGGGAGGEGRGGRFGGSRKGAGAPRGHRRLGGGGPADLHSHFALVEPHQQGRAKERGGGALCALQKAWSHAAAAADARFKQ